MKKNSIFMAGIPAVLLVFGLLLAGCPTDGGGGGGGGGNLWSQLTQGTGTWTPNAGGDYPSFKFEDHGGGHKGCEVRNASGNQKVAGTCELDGNTITAGSTTFQVAIENDLLTVSAWSKSDEAATYNGTYKRKTETTNNPPTGTIDYRVSANGTANTTATTALTLTFTSAVSGLSAADITLTTDGGAVTRGTLTGSGTTWTLSVTTAKAGNVKVKITKDGIAGSDHAVTVYSGPPPGGDDGDPSSKLVGTWVGNNGTTITFELKSYGGKSMLIYDAPQIGGGTVDVTSTTIDFGGDTATYTFSNGDRTLTLSGTDDTDIDGVYTKQ